MDDTATGTMPADQPTEGDDPEAGARPTALLPMTQLARISAYWLGLTAIDAAVGLFITNRLEFDALVPKDDVGQSMFMIGVFAAIVGILIQPTVGYISDYTVSRWGRRKPYIVFGSLLDVVFLLGIATGSTRPRAGRLHAPAQRQHEHRPRPVPGVRAGPRRGAPGRPRERHGRHDAGRRQRHGLPAGVALGRPRASWSSSLVAVAIVELVTMLSVVLKVGKGMPPKPREGKIVDDDRPRGLGDRHPPGAVLRLAARLPAAVPDSPAPCSSTSS